VTSHCQVCRRRPGVHNVDVMGESGGSPVHTCDPCSTWLFERIRQAPTDVCVNCREATSDKYHIFEYGRRDAPHGRLCSDCRRRLLFGHGDPLRPADTGGNHD
jgi:formate dehydrogenase maturation protein FdhE